MQVISKCSWPLQLNIQHSCRVFICFVLFNVILILFESVHSENKPILFLTFIWSMFLFCSFIFIFINLCVVLFNNGKCSSKWFVCSLFAFISNLSYNFRLISSFIQPHQSIKRIVLNHWTILFHYKSWMQYSVCIYVLLSNLELQIL